MKATKLVILLLLAVVIATYFALGLDQLFSLEGLKEMQGSIVAWHQADPWQSALVFFAAYVAVTGLSLPGALIMSVAAGALFGLVAGTTLVSFASTLGATAAFFLSRHLFRDLVQRRFGRHLEAVNRGIDRDGAWYLLTLRLVPAFPFFVINLIMGLTTIRPLTFMLVSQAGMLAATVLVVNAGTQLAQLDSAADILSPALIGSLTLLGTAPLLIKKAVEWLKTRKVVSAFEKPRRFDRNVVVIGAGSAGLVTSYIAAALEAEVTLIERHKMGGDCLNTGCVPSKALIRSAKFLAHVGRAKEFGIASARADFDFAQVMERVQRVIKTVEPHDSVERYAALGVECIHGEARIRTPYSVEVNGRVLTTRNIVLATGARPLVPKLPGIENVGYLTSDTVWSLRERPARLLVLGGGPIGSELAQAFSRLGSRVTLVERGPALLKREDPEIAEMVMARFRAEGIDLRLGHKAKEFVTENGEKHLVCEYQGREECIGFDQVLIALGRVANVDGYGLEELGIHVTERGTVEVNEFLQTRYPNIFACGDVVGPFQFTHAAAHQAWYATVNALFGRLKRFKVDYSVIPWATFTDPEVARVGINEKDAKARSIPYEVTTYGIDDLDRAIADEEAHGVVKVLTVPGKDKILGVTIVGEHAGDLIAEYVLAMRRRIGLNQILGTVHIYPTMAEANKHAAGQWRRAHTPRRLLRWAKRYHAWQRRSQRKPQASDTRQSHIVTETE